jgi:hypothetical protein
MGPSPWEEMKIHLPFYIQLHFWRLMPSDSSAASSPGDLGRFPELL